jgi:predicted nuclease with TOPRIM domain
MGIIAAFRAVIYLVIAAGLAFSAYYIMNLKADLAISESNAKALESATRQQNALIESMRADIETIQKTNAELAATVDKQRQDVETLNTKFSKRDFGALAAEKPAVVEKLVNRGTVNALRCMELASGAPLTEIEKNAKTPMEANRECPALIDSDYTAPVR